MMIATQKKTQLRENEHKCELFLEKIVLKMML